MLTARGKYRKAKSFGEESPTSSPSLEELSLPNETPPRKPEESSARTGPEVAASSSGARTLYFPASGVPKAYVKNVACNQKYSVWTFLPRVLYEQFKYFMNFYFLLVALSQLVPVLSVGFLFTYFAPLVFVIFVTMAKEGFDDYKRFKRDQEMNGEHYEILERVNRKKQVPASKLKVGDLVSLKRGERVPADLILLQTESGEGACFIRTDQLDGETDWKLRTVVKATQRIPQEALLDMTAILSVENPCKSIHSFHGNFSTCSGVSQNNMVDWSSVVDQEPLDINQTLWANTVIASDAPVIGVVVYTGPETRAMMNVSHPSTKVGLTDIEINRLTMFLFCFTTFLSLLMVAFREAQSLTVLYMMRFMILFSSIIPISLRVNLDMAKLVNSRRMDRDPEIPETVVRNSNVPEELGRLEYLLTDKTGTLTRNEMEVKKLNTGALSVTSEAFPEIRDRIEEELEEEQKGIRQRTGGRQSLRGLVTTLSLCHNVTPTRSSESSEVQSYLASSPDEIAIVEWTRVVGVELFDRNQSSITLRACTGAKISYDILKLFPFTSESKRMGIVVRDANNCIWFMQKGADAVMNAIVLGNDWLKEECENMAREGLRTLVIGRKRISEEVWDSFSKQLKAAELRIQGRSEEIQRVISEHLEHEVEPLGVIGIEDKLQDSVRSTFENLRNAGVRIWMLTGDKLETAVCIGLSTRLIGRNQHVFHMANVLDPQEARRKLDELTHCHDSCLVIDGESLATCLKHYRDDWLDLATRLSSVICCRCSPTQKADIALNVRRFTHRRVCAIGDGGNDVSMILAANIGIGIVGKEGKQASLAADISITKFGHCENLLLWHGRLSYKSTASLAYFVIHRGLVIALMQAIFSAMFYFSPISLYQGILLMGYTTVYTMAPVFSMVLDQDVSYDAALLYPELYKELVKGRLLSFKMFAVWLFVSVYQAGTIMVLASLLFESEFQRIESVSFTALILTELCLVAVRIDKWHRYMIYSFVGTIAIYLLSILLLPAVFDLDFIFSRFFLSKLGIIVASTTVPVLIVDCLRLRYDPPSYRKVGRY